jgi:hypothetical protein
MRRLILLGIGLLRNLDSKRLVVDGLGVRTN